MATVKKRTWISNGQKKEAWRVSYTDAGGKRRFVQKATKREADSYRVKVEGELAQGVHTADAASVTVADAIDIWIAACEAAGCDRSTMKTYKEIANGHIRPRIGAIKLSKLSAPKVVDFRDDVLLDCSHAMASKAVRHLSMILGEALNRGLVGQNVAHAVKVKRPRGEKQRIAKRAEIPQTDHLKLLIQAADEMEMEDPRAPVLLAVVMLCGLRSSELRGLAWPGIAFNTGNINVVQRADRWCDLGPPKSAAGLRSIPMGPALTTKLKAWKLRCRKTDKNLVFPNADGGVLDQKGIIALFLAIQARAGLAIDSGKRDRDGKIIWKPRYGLHDIRHVAASNWIAQKIDLKRLQVWIGHANIALTIDVYGHLIVDAQKDAELATQAEKGLFA
jgi:integrase